MKFSRQKQAGALLFALIIITLILFRGVFNGGNTPFFMPDSPIDSTDIKPIKVYLKGAVISEGVYNIPAGSRLKTLLIKAGGLSPKVNLRLIDLYAPLADEQVVYIPLRNRLPDKVDLNISSSFWLSSIKGIGPIKAKKIVRYRDRLGAFKNISEIQNVKGIGPKTFKKIKSELAVHYAE